MIFASSGGFPKIRPGKFLALILVSTNKHDAVAGKKAYNTLCAELPKSSSVASIKDRLAWIYPLNYSEHSCTEGY
jgi:hypothetical protein